jgi:hypothetical protein
MVLRRFLPQYQLAGLWKGARRSPSPHTELRSSRVLQKALKSERPTASDPRPSHPPFLRREQPQPRRGDGTGALCWRHALRDQSHRR